MGFLLAAMGAAGDAGVQSINQNIAQQNVLDQEAWRSQLAQDKEIAVAQAQEAIKNGPINRFGALAATHANDTVPVQPAPVTDLSGNGTAFDGQPLTQQGTEGTGIGLQGDLKKILAEVNSWPDTATEKQNVLAQLNSQIAADTQANQAAVAGKTRKADNGSIIVAAMNDALASGDGQAYAAGLGLQNMDAKMANMQNRLDMAQYRYDTQAATAADRTATMKEIADVRADALKYGYELRLKAAQERENTGKFDAATGRMLITSEDANIRASTTQLSMLGRQLEITPAQKAGKPNPDYVSINGQMDDLRASIKDSQANKRSYLKSMGLMSDTAPSPASSIAAPTPAQTSAPTPTSPTPAKPQSKAEFDSLPRGALFVNPADGLTYKKN